MLEVRKKNEGKILEVLLKGRLDTATSPQLEGEIKDDLGEIEKLVIDFFELEYISSAGLRVILSTQKKMNVQGKMVIKNVNEEIMEVFEMTGFSDILTIE